MMSAAATAPASWRTGWTVEQPLRLDFAFSPAAAARWIEGPFAGLEMRDLGLSTATHGLMTARHVRIAPGAVAAATPWRAHDVDFHFLYVLAGRMTLETDARQTVLAAGAALCLPRFLRYRQAALSPDLAFLEIAAPGAPATLLGRDAALPAGATPGVAAQILHETPQSYTQGAGPRKFFQYRDLGTAGPTDGRIYIHIVRATAPQEGGTGWHTHTMRQWFWVLRGSAGIAVEGRKDITRVDQYDAMCISAGLRHNVPSFTEDYLVIEMCIPAEYDTTATPPPD
jgi:mannose-6-phosphate isomerase-like protein (cupin superfamily)